MDQSIKNRRKKKWLGTPLQEKIMKIIFLSALVPVCIVAMTLYYMILQILTWQMQTPGAVSSEVIRAANRICLIIFISLPVVLGGIWIFALNLSHRIAGPLYRLERELESQLGAGKYSPITLRKGDELTLLTEKINKLTEKINLLVTNRDKN